MIYKPSAPPETQAASACRARTRARSGFLVVNGERHELRKRRTVIGRSKDCDLQLDDANASRRHAEVRQEGTTYWIIDLDSTNGLEVERQAGEGAEARRGRQGHDRRDRPRLRRGDRMTLGDSIAVDEALLVLKALFLVLLYLFIWRIVRSASKDVRLPQESFILRPGEGDAAMLAQQQPLQTGRLVVLKSPAIAEGTTFELDASCADDRPRRPERRAARGGRVHVRAPRALRAAARRRLGAGPRFDERHVRERARRSTAPRRLARATSSASARPT
jgi:hypothetical protein